MDDPGPGEATDSRLGGALADARPTGDALALVHAQGRLGAALFGELVQPTRLGRFVLLDRLGAGGMGVVYSAYDPTLDRRVALKLLRSRRDGDVGSAHKQLAREARALARLSHPNVVPVHDVCVLDDHIALVMELVAGQTLRAWLAGTPRAIRDVLDVYVQAARGLAAAHAVGIVHRDFKPDNALIGDDGRVRVVDFGLAQARSSRLDEQDRAAIPAGVEPQAVVDDSTAASGGLIGTPSYMAPEQLAGDRVGPAADQFAFCVALYEALYGERPVDRGAPESPADGGARRAGASRERRVPRSVHAAICRGLAREPADRHPAMSSLIAALTRDPARTRRRRLLGLSFVALAGLALYGFVHRSPAALPCEGGTAAVSAVWNAERRARIGQALEATGRSYAASVAPRLLSGLDAYAAAWARTHHDACMSHQRGEQSDALLDRRMRCLDGRLRALDSAGGVLTEIDAASLSQSMQVVEGLPSLWLCDDAEALAAEVPLPEDAALAGRVNAVRGRLAQGKALEDVGRYADAVALERRAVVDAEALAYEPALAEALLAEGRSRMMIATSGIADAVLPLRRAAELGLAHGQLALAVEALARSFYVEGVSGRAADDRAADLDALFPFVESLSRRVGGDRLARPLLLNNLGTVFLGRGDRDRARMYFERALDAMTRIPDPPLELTCVHRNLAMVTPDAARRDEIMTQALDRVEQTLGPAHPWTLDLRRAYAHYVPDPARGRKLLAPACEQYERYHPDQVTARLYCLYYLGFLDAELGDRASAARTLATAASLDPAQIEGQELVWRDLAGAYAAIYRGDPAAALAPLRAVIARLGAPHVDVWTDEPIAHARLGLGLAQHALGADGPALRELEAAATLFRALGALNENVEQAQRRAVAEAALAAIRIAREPGSAR